MSKHGTYTDEERDDSGDEADGERPERRRRGHHDTRIRPGERRNPDGRRGKKHQFTDPGLKHAFQSKSYTSKSTGKRVTARRYELLMDVNFAHAMTDKPGAVASRRLYLEMIGGLDGLRAGIFELARVAAGRPKINEDYLKEYLSQVHVSMTPIGEQVVQSEAASDLDLSSHHYRPAECAHSTVEDLLPAKRRLMDLSKEELIREVELLPRILRHRPEHARVFSEDLPSRYLPDERAHMDDLDDDEAEVAHDDEVDEESHGKAEHVSDGVGKEARGQTAADGGTDGDQEERDRALWDSLDDLQQGSIEYEHLSRKFDPEFWAKAEARERAANGSLPQEERPKGRELKDTGGRRPHNGKGERTIPV